MADVTYETFLETHQKQLQLSAVPETFWKTLWQKLTGEVFDAGDVFQIEVLPRSPKQKESFPRALRVIAEKGLSPTDPNNIYLIDHAVLYDARTVRDHLSHTTLVDRLCNLMGYENTEKADKDKKLDFILSEMWRYNQFFTLSDGTIEERMPLWYIMDEVGSAITHSDDPNFRTVPFLHRVREAESCTYTLLFPIERAKFADVVTRDFVEGLTSDRDKRRALLLPWIGADFTKQSFIQTEPSEDYFLSGHQSETLPRLGAIESAEKIVRSKLKVYSEYSYVNKYLTHPRFEIVENIDDADIYWLMKHFKDYERLSSEKPHVYVNQFPFEYVLTIKDLLAIICRRKSSSEKFDPETLETYPAWLPTTYNLSTELCQFVSYFERRESLGLDNHWICKPWNLARGLDIHLTDNLNHILRLPPTGPKIAQKYISSPVLYTRPEIGRVKFDIRYVVLLKSAEPLVAYAYSNFFLRFANKEFALNNLDDYEQHFTVMNYLDDSRLYHVKCHDFMREWKNTYPDFDWKNIVEVRILKMLRDILEAAVQAQPPKGIPKSPQSRAIYAADLMLQWKNNDIQPAILEFNFSPDNKRACEYYPDFYNDVFKCLFLDETNPDVFHHL